MDLFVVFPKEIQAIAIENIVSASVPMRFTIPWLLLLNESFFFMLDEIVCNILLKLLEFNLNKWFKISSNIIRRDKNYLLFCF